MDTNELKVIMASLYGFTATQLVQQISAINALERTLEDIKKGASWQSLDLCLESAISTLETIKNTPCINSERSENTQTLNIDRIRTMTAKELAYTLAHRWFASDTELVYDWLMSKYTGFDRGHSEKTHSERSENLSTLNIDYIRSLSIEKLASSLHTLCTECYLAGYNDSDYYCKECPISEVCPRCNSITEFMEWLVSEHHSERSEKEDADE